MEGINIIEDTSNFDGDTISEESDASEYSEHENEESGTLGINKGKLNNIICVPLMKEEFKHFAIFCRC